MPAKILVSGPGQCSPILRLPAGTKHPESHERHPRSLQIKYGRSLASGRIGSRLGRDKLTFSCQATTLEQQAEQVIVEVDKASRNARRLYAAVSIDAPLDHVWRSLTDYEGLGNFIPGLAENRCLERRPQGAKLRQVGQQDLALGAKFRATVVLDIQEYAAGVPSDLCAAATSRGNGQGSQESLFPEPRSSASDGDCQDIAFSMVEGDFLAFRGIWRMQQTSPTTTRLSYALHVQPQAWLPVRMVQGRIVGEVRVNLTAVRQHSERVFSKSKIV